MRTRFVLGFLFLLLTCAEEEEIVQPKDVVDLMPTDNEITGWTRTGNMRVAETATELYALINGDGNVYTDNGFVKYADQKLSSSVQESLFIEIVDIGDTVNAKTVYDERGDDTETPWIDNHAGTEARIDENLLFNYEIDFRDSRYYCYIVIFEKTQSSLDIAKIFALNISDAIKDTAQ